MLALLLAYRAEGSAGKASGQEVHPQVTVSGEVHLPYVSLHDIPVWPVRTKGSLSVSVPFDQGNVFETSVFQAQR